MLSSPPSPVIRSSGAHDRASVYLVEYTIYVSSDAEYPSLGLKTEYCIQDMTYVEHDLSHLTCGGGGGGGSVTLGSIFVARWNLPEYKWPKLRKSEFYVETSRSDHEGENMY